MQVILNEEFELIFEFRNGKKYKASSFYANINVYKQEIQQKDYETIEILEFSKKIKLEEEIIELTRFPLKCNFKEKKGVFVYSLEHLDLILKRIQYNNPFYISKFSNEFISLKNLDAKWEIFIDEEISIEDLPFSKDVNRKIYYDQSSLIEEFKKLNFNRAEFSYNIISYNLRNYLDFFPNIDLNEKFYYVDSPERRRLQRNIDKFLLDKNDKIYAVYGPYGIGKSLTALIIQKYLYINKYRTIYINLKYYSKKITFDIKFQTLISECFFLSENEKEFELYHKLLLENKSKDIWFCLNAIYNYITTNKKDLSKYLFIIDQYKMSYDINYSVLNFPDIHVFILSSINDKDIKYSLISSLKGINPKIKYNYIEKLIKDTVKGILFNYKEKVLNKLSSEIKASDEEKFDFISKILNLFGNLPRFIALLLNKYTNVFDLLNNEYKNIFIKVFEFYKWSNLKVIEELKNNNFFSRNEFKSLSKIDFANYLNDIPLKYINFREENNQYFLEFSFLLCEIILDDYFLFNKSINTLKINDKDNPVGQNFEFILKICMRVFKLFNIDGYIEVNSIIELNLENNYKYVDKNYFVGKKNILIAQKKPNGKAFDFCIYKPEENIIILLQSKYIINNNNVENIYYYKNNGELVKKAFKKKLLIDIEKIYLLYISSYEYNINRKEKVLKCLKSHQINCIFYNYFENIASFNFKDLINEMPLKDSYIIYPYPKEREYYEQWKEKKIIKANKNLWNTFLNKKHFQERKNNNYKNVNEIKDYRKALYERFLQIVRVHNNLISDVFNLFGMFFEFHFECYGQSITIPDYEIYIFIFKTKGISTVFIEIDESKDLGLIYLHENEILFLDIKNQIFLEENEFNKKFYDYSFAIGKYFQK